MVNGAIDRMLPAAMAESGVKSVLARIMLPDTRTRPNSSVVPFAVLPAATVIVDGGVTVTSLVTAGDVPVPVAGAEMFELVQETLPSDNPPAPPETGLVTLEYVLAKT